MHTASSSTSSPAEGAPPAPTEEAPPFLGSWRRIYGVVIAELVITVLLFWLITRWAS